MLGFRSRWRQVSGTIGAFLAIVTIGCGEQQPAANPPAVSYPPMAVVPPVPPAPGTIPPTAPSAPGTVPSPAPVAAGTVPPSPSASGSPQATSDVRYPIENGVVFGPGNSSPVYCDGKLIDIASGEAGKPLQGTKHATYEGGPFASRLAISPDGKAVAQWVNPRDRGARDTGKSTKRVYLFATSTGQAVRDFALPPLGRDSDPRVLELRFLEPRILLVALSAGFNVQFNTFDVVTGEVKDQLPLTDVSESDLHFSDDGRRYLRRDGDRCTVQDVVLKKRVSELELPADNSRILLAKFVFSPDGDEVATLADDKFLVWNVSDGKLILDHPIETRPSLNTDIGWVSGNLGWALDGKQVLWREPRMMAWELNVHNDHFGHQRLRFVGSKAVLQTGKTLIVMNPPVAAIEQAIAASKDPANLLIPPGAAVKIEVLVSQVQHATAAEAAAALRKTVAELLTARGYVVADQAPITLHVAHSEKVGDRLQIRDIETRATGESVEDTLFTFSMKLDAGAGPVWNFDVAPAKSTTIGNDRTPAGLRRNSFALLQDRIRSASLPSFIPKAGGSSLPIRTTLAQ